MKLTAKVLRAIWSLNGFAEFIRNLLVCKDPKSAALLDVVEGLQDKYVQTAASI